MKRRTGGFTLLELVIVIMIGSILTGVALQSFQNVQARFAVEGAKRVYMTWHQRARSMAIEKGETVLMVVYTGGDSAAIVRDDGGSWVWSDVQHFDEELNVDIRVNGNTSGFYLCMTPRGYADESCGSWGATGGYSPTYSTPVRLEFWLNADSASVLILPMGQLVG